MVQLEGPSFVPLRWSDRELTLAPILKSISRKVAKELRLLSFLQSQSAFGMGNTEKLGNTEKSEKVDTFSTLVAELFSHIP